MNDKDKKDILIILNKLVDSLGEISDNLHDCTLEIEAIIKNARKESSSPNK